MIKFPKGFMFGAATSAHQVEGGNVNSDWWLWEKEAGKEQSGSACRHYELYAQDFDIAQSLNHSAHRLSIEWARIEPEDGVFSQDALKHYVAVIQSLKARNIEPIVTLHHFTNPLWLSKRGGWERKETSDRFARYCGFVVAELSKYVKYWITINEPTIYVSHAYLFGAWPPQIKSIRKMMIVSGNLMSAHIKTYRLMHKIYRGLRLPDPFVGFSQFTQAFLPCTLSLKHRLAAYLRNEWYNFGFIKHCLRNKALDFIGINYYSRQLVEFAWWDVGGWFTGACRKNHHQVSKNSLGWDIYPQGLYDILLKLKRHNLPVMITENGICTSDDNQRWEYIKAHLRQIHRAIEQGVDLRGYLYWSLLDNFEWDKGFGPRFGLVEMDYNAYKRTVRESAQKFADVCRTGVLKTEEK